MFARTPASPPCSCPLRLSPSGKTVDPEAPLPASPVCDRDSTRRFHGAHSRLIRLLHSSLRPHALLPQNKQVGIAAGDAPQPVHGRKGLASDTGSSHRWLAGLLGRSVGSLPSAGVTRLQRYDEPVRPCASHRYAAPQGSAPWRSPLASRRQVPTFRTRASRWSHAVFMPVAARPVGRLPPSFVAGQQREPGFGDVPRLSTRQQRFTHIRLTSAHLTGLIPPFPQRSPPRPLDRRSLRWFGP